MATGRAKLASALAALRKSASRVRIRLEQSSAGLDMQGRQIDPEDMLTLAAILEKERRSHAQKRALCLGLFLFSLFALLVALGIVVHFLVNLGADGEFDQAPVLGQLLTGLSAAVVGFFSMWWSAQNCINSIERTLYAAKAGRPKLFFSFLEQLQCTDKKKRAVLLEMVSAAVV